ncbi:MAG: thioredoxin-dependent thiol peroxidase [Elusimicrobia bacterium]|nr:thioredoxin-dependent thiol peroxidase [Elusimicrobiota bacterium]
MLKVGDKAPAFLAKDQSGRTVSLADFKGKTVVLYFYPRDLTPGCTAEACGFQSAQAALKKKGAVVLGVSKDSAATHKKFANKQGLTFPLLADEAGAIVQAYGAWGDKSLYGKKYKGILRITYIIGPDGKVVSVFPKVKPAEHPADVLAAL